MRRLFTEPSERGNEIKKFRTIKVNSCVSIGLSADKKRRPGGAQRDTRTMKRGIGIFNGAHHRCNDATMFVGECNDLL